MKKTILSLLIIFLACAALNAQEETETVAEPESEFQWNSHPWTLGIGVDYGMNTRENFALGYGITFERYLFCPWLALGVRGMMYTDFQTVSSTEALVTLRLWLLSFKKAFFFTQWGFGMEIYSEEDRSINAFIMDALFGCRIHLGKKSRFYVEPYIRGGFPFVFSIGVSAGRRFDL